MKKLLLFLIIPFLSFGQCIDGDFDNDGICDEIDDCVGTWIADITTGNCDQFTSQGADVCGSYVGCEWTYSWGGWVTGGSSDCVGSYEIDSGYCDELEFLISGCVDESACNYSELATEDDGSCDYLNVAFSVSPAICSSGLGSAWVDEILGGNPPYIIDWGGIDTESIPAGFYNLTITDSDGCLFQETFYIDEPEPIQVDYVVQDAICEDESGSITITEILGGNPPYIIDWQNISPEYTPIGTYEFIIIDIEGCEFFYEYTINNLNEDCGETGLNEHPNKIILVTKIGLLGINNNKGFNIEIYDDGSVEKKYLIR